MSDTQHTHPADVRYLGKQSPLPASPQEAVLDYVPNPRPHSLYLTRFVSPEFTSLCPVTGQPDFAHLVLDYAPAETIVESKSLKLFLSSFRNHDGFHEDVTVGIGERLAQEMNPGGCASAATGIRAAAFRSTSSGRPARRLKACGCRIREWPPIAGGGSFVYLRPCGREASAPLTFLTLARAAGRPCGPCRVRSIPGISGLTESLSSIKMKC